MREDGIDPFGDMVRRGQPAPMVGTGSPGTMLLEMWAPLGGPYRGDDVRDDVLFILATLKD
jgi:hypothetical protein